MKKIIYRTLVALVAVIMSVACQSEGEQYLNQIVGEWHYTGSDSNVDEDIWIAFNSDMTFELYQKIGDGVHRCIKGTYSINVKDKIISGLYEDNYPWKDDYKFNVSDKVLALQTVSDGQHYAYARQSIPSEVRTMSLPLVKSGCVFGPRCL